MNKSRDHFLYVALLLVGIAFIAWGVGCQPSQKQSGPPEKITISFASACISILAHIAFSKGYFAEEGLDATPQHLDSGKAALQSVVEGKADLATVATTPILFSILGDQKIMILAVIEATSNNEAILVREDRGIVKPADFKGRTIGFVRGASGDYFADVFLKAHGVKRSQVKTVDLKQAEMATALHTGRIDAASIWNPLFIQRQLVRESGDKGRLFYGGTLFTEIGCLAARQDFVKQHPETIRKVLRALIKAERFAIKDPAEARRLVAEFVPEMDRPILDAMWNDLFLRVTLDQSLILDLEDQTKWAINTDLTKRKDMPNYLDFIYFDGLQAVRPEAVRITR